MSASSLKFVTSNGTAVKEEVNRKLPKSFYEIERAENMKMASRRLKHDPAINIHLQNQSRIIALCSKCQSYFAQFQQEKEIEMLQETK